MATVSAPSTSRPDSPHRERLRGQSRIDATTIEHPDTTGAPKIDHFSYLDWAAATPPDPSILDTARDRAIAAWANPSSAHAPGQVARAELEQARAMLAQACGDRKGSLVFTASGTEADQIPLLAVVRSRHSGLRTSSRILISDIEHPAIHAQAAVLSRMGIDVDRLKPDGDGRIDPQDVAEALRKDTALVAIMAVNNETGAVQDTLAIGRAISQAAASLGRKAPAFHCDAVQALGKIPLSVAEWSEAGVTSAAFSAHKLRGPKGSGALWLASPFETLATGGGQEGGIRSGTESIQSAWGFALAAKTAVDRFEANRMRALELEEVLLTGIASIPGVHPVPDTRTPGDPRWSPCIVSLSFPGLSGEVLVRALSDCGVAVSTGSACSEASRGAKSAKKRRRILEAMGLSPELSLSSIRVSTGPLSAREDVDRFLEAASTLYRRLKT